MLVSMSLMVFLSCSKKSPAADSSSVEVSGQGTLHEGNFPFNKGEEVHYEIKNLGIRAGEATLTYEGIVDYRGQKFFLIIFRAEGLNFFDEEKIYASTKDFYPVFVQRDLNIWGKKEKIEEQYWPQKGQIKIIKDLNGKKEEQVIEKEGLIDNIYCFIYRYRAQGDFELGEYFTIHLPTKDVKITLKKETTVRTAGGAYTAYYMQSNPSQYKVWFGKSAKKKPLRINGSIGLSATSMTMMDYKEGYEESEEKSS